jgi:hypothetical protein
MKRLKKIRPVTIAFVAVAAVLVIGGAAAGMLVWHEQPTFCAALCHIMQPYEDGWASSEYEAHLHAVEEVECLDCHESSVRQQMDELTKFVAKDYKIPLRERKLKQEVCLSCKEHDSYPELAETTKDWPRNVHASHWGDMECYLCHKQHRPNVLYCTKCHTDLTLPEGWEKNTEIAGD